MQESKFYLSFRIIFWIHQPVGKSLASSTAMKRKQISECQQKATKQASMHAAAEVADK